MVYLFEIGELSNLHTLYLNNNQLHNLHLGVRNLPLVNFYVHGNAITFPPENVTAEGRDAIFRFSCMIHNRIPLTALSFFRYRCGGDMAHRDVRLGIRVIADVESTKMIRNPYNHLSPKTMFVARIEYIPNKRGRDPMLKKALFIIVLLLVLLLFHRNHHIGTNGQRRRHRIRSDCGRRHHR